MLNIIDPFLQGIKRRPARYVINDDRNCGVSYVIGNQCSESLLTCRIPQLESNCLILQENVLRYEVYTDGWSLK